MEELKRLARAFSDGVDCGFALHDQLIECGFPRQATWFVYLIEMIPLYRNSTTVHLLMQRSQLYHYDMESWERDCPNPG